MLYYIVDSVINAYLSAMLEFEPKVEDAVGNFVEAGELLEVELVTLDHVISRAASPVQEGSAKKENNNGSSGRLLLLCSPLTLFYTTYMIHDLSCPKMLFLYWFYRLPRKIFSRFFI